LCISIGKGVVLQSKVFLIVVFIFILCLVIVGWYFLEMYGQKAQIAMTKGTEYSIGEKVQVSYEDQDVEKESGIEFFWVWLKQKTSIVINSISLNIPSF